MNLATGIVEYQKRERNKEKKAPQMWNMGAPDADGWRSIKHNESHYLTVITKKDGGNILTIATKGTKMIIAVLCSICYILYCQSQVN